MPEWVSVAIMWIIIDNCKIHTHMNQRLCAMCMRVAVALAMYYWLGWRSEFSANGGADRIKKVFSQTQLESSAYAVLDPVTLSFERWFSIPFLRLVIFLYSYNCEYTFPFPLPLSHSNSRRQERARPCTERTSEWKKINIFYILCDLCHFESIRTVHILYYNVYCWRWYCILFHGSLCCAWLSSNANKTSCDWRAHHINRELNKRARARECTTGKKSHTVLFALKLHNHKSREMNIIQMSSDEILMYVMPYIRTECVFFLYTFLLIHRLFVCDRVRSRFECVARHSQWEWTWKKWRKKMRWMCCECISRPLCYISIFTWIDMSSIKAARYY